MNPYEKCPVFENENYLLRFVKAEDAPDLLLVYSDEKAVPIFNSDNCVDNFHYICLEQMQRTIAFWQQEYEKKYYVRWTIWDKKTCHAIGTIELFNRKAEDYFNDCGLLRLDLRSDYEYTDIILEILSLILESASELFECVMMATKVPACAAERKKAVEKLGFILSKEELIGGHNGKTYRDYYVLSSPIDNRLKIC